MVKQTKTICWLLPMNSLSVFYHFVMFALKGLAFHSWLLEQPLGLWQRVFFVTGFNAKK